MTNHSPSMELLAPAGSEDAFRAALHNGADAIYLGAGPHHARQYAGGFSEPVFFSLVDEAHVAGVKVYLTLNTLLTGTELETAFAWAERAWAGGVDALILQDIGLARLLHTRRPDIVLHASTQMSLHNLDGVQAAQAAGFSRVVLARELSLPAIAAIRAGTGIELEVFGHGALCVSYSGQCLMSSLIGGRSGNRGTCAQPCRLPWKMTAAEDGGFPGAAGWPRSAVRPETAEGYLLSMKDLMALPFLPSLQAAGVTSVKIEGRMKSPEYVATVTGIYRRHLDRLAEEGAAAYSVDPQDETALRQIFNRGGFTGRYLAGRTGEGSLAGPDGQVSAGSRLTDGPLVDPVHPKHLGIRVGVVRAWRAPYAEVRLEEAMSLGDGLEVHPGGKGGTGVVSTILTAIVDGGAHVREVTGNRTVLLGDIKEPVRAGDVVYRTSQKSQLAAAVETVAHWHVRRVPLSMAFRLRGGEPAHLTVTDPQGHQVAVVSSVPAESARERPLSPERVEAQLAKSGDAAWAVRDVRMDLDGVGILPVKEINAMRRQALEELARVRVLAGRHADCQEPSSLPAAPQSSPSPVSLSIPAPVERIPLPIDLARITLAFALPPTPEWVREALRGVPAGSVRLLVPPMAQGAFEALAVAAACPVWLRTPSILPGDRADRLIRRILPLLETAAGLSAGNPGTLHLLRTHAPTHPILADFGMNLWNRWAVSQAAAWGADLALLSPELPPDARAMLVGRSGKAGEDRTDSPDPEPLAIPVSDWAYGRVPVMTMEHCPGSLAGPCDRRCGACTRSAGVLTDRAGAAFPWIRDPFTEKTIIHHHRPIRKRREEWFPQAACLHVWVTDESASTVARIVEDILSETPTF